MAKIKYVKYIFLVFIFFLFFSNQTNVQAALACKYPEASKRHLTDRDLKGKSMLELKIMRNEIFARHGYKFKTRDMKEYFKKQKWYKPKYTNVTLKLTKIETANIKMLKEYENNIKSKDSSANVGELIKKQKRKIVFKANWGSGRDQLGRDIAQEADSSGPMSFAIDDSGMLFILDQVNKRIQVYNKSGKYIKTVPVPNSLISDIGVGQSENLFLLDQWKNGAVLLIDDKGNILKKIGLVGKGISELGSVTGICSCRDGIWVDYEKYSVKICDTSGEEDKDRPALTGDITRDGNYFLASRKLGDITVSITRHRPGKSNIDHYELYFKIPVLYIHLLDMDRNNNIFVGVNLLDQSRHNSPPYSIEESHEIVVILDNRGNEKQRIYMPVSTKYLSVTRSLRVAPDGSVYQLVLEEDGAIMWKYGL